MYLENVERDTLVHTHGSVKVWKGVMEGHAVALRKLVIFQTESLYARTSIGRKIIIVSALSDSSDKECNRLMNLY